MRLALCLCLLTSAFALAEQVSPEQDCKFVAWWANKAFHISHTIGLEEEKWTIAEEGFPPEVYAVINQIKREAYHDLPALRARVEAVCAEKEAT